MLFIKKAVEYNIYLCELIKSTAGIKYNRKMLEFIKNVSKIDSIEDSEILKNEFENLPPTKLMSFHSLKHSYAENTLYGYADSVMKYAGIDSKDIFYLPLLEHGISVESVFTGNMNRAYIFEGKYKQEYWKNNMRSPIYFIGPYIHYAEEYYQAETMKKKKNYLGKNLLIFPPHSTEFDSASYKLDDFNNYLFNNIGKKYDSISACVYWLNLDDQYVQFLKANGVKIVCAGFKLDPMFVSRLKSIISLADTVLYPSFTTSIGFSYYMKKRVIFKNNFSNISLKSKCSEDIQEKMNSEYKTMSEIFADVFSEDSVPFSSEQYALIDKYWGLSEVKSKEEIRNIFDKNKKYIRSRLGF